MIKTKSLKIIVFVQFSHVWLFVTPWNAAHQASLFFTTSRSSPKPMSIESVMPSIHLILCHPLLLLPSIFPSIRVFSNESVLHIRWPKHWSFSFNISLSNECSGLWKCCIQHASKFGKLSSGHRTGKSPFSFQSQRKAMPKNAWTTAQLLSSHKLVK